MVKDVSGCIFFMVWDGLMWWREDNSRLAVFVLQCGAYRWGYFYKRNCGHAYTLSKLFCETVVARTSGLQSEEEEWRLSGGDSYADYHNKYTGGEYDALFSEEGKSGKHRQEDDDDSHKTIVENTTTQLFGLLENLLNNGLVKRSQQKKMHWVAEKIGRQ